jgi:putative molybdopterin biosynthesis protein
MKQIYAINSFAPLKLLGDKRRLEILSSLMVKPATLSQLGKKMDMHPAQVRHHLKKLEEAGFVEMTSTSVVRGFVEKYYQATARAFMVNLTIVPEHSKKNTILATGSHDLALELLALELAADKKTPDLLIIPLGSLDGLIAIRQGFGQLAGCHLLDLPSGEYNLPFVRYLFPDQEVRLITLAHRTQGLIVPSGNPKEIQGLQDLTGPDIRFINRKRGTGTRLWLEQQLGEAKIPPENIQGYDLEAETHLQVAKAVGEGKADAGVGLVAAAHKYDLEVVPLFTERYDLVIPDEHYQNPLLLPVLETLRTEKFRQEAENLGGYDTRETGNEIKIH